MKVVSYYNVIPAKNKSEEKFNILRKFTQGVNVAGDTGILHQGFDLQQCDVGMIQGWQHEHGKNLPHLQLRQRVIDRTDNTHVCTADSNLFLYANNQKNHHYLRYSFDGVFPNTGNYFDNNVTPSRWQQISKDLNINIENTKVGGNHILICAQRNGGWSMGKVNLDTWLLDTCKKIRLHSDRPIIVRLHPSDNQTNRRAPQIQQLLKQVNGVAVSAVNRTIIEDLQNCYAVVNHNSSSIVGPIIMGYSAFITDATKSQCAEVAHLGFEKLESPQQFDRQHWLERISMFHWKFSELEDGSAWRHIRQYVNS